VLHAYLEGTGIELMANSDNVLRGGLTGKHIDVPELLNIVTFKDGGLSLISPTTHDPMEQIYRTPADEFQLSHLRIRPGMKYEAHKRRNIELFICISGNGTVRSRDKREILEIKKGESFLVPASAEVYSIQGEVELYKATVP
ncbi:MAG: mannose-6-phosphate isomerase, class I, partial [Spirochaetota bacterium]